MTFTFESSTATKLAELINCDEAFLKGKSPMCGVGEIYNGKFENKLIKGDGLFTRMLKDLGIKVNRIG